MTLEKNLQKIIEAYVKIGTHLYHVRAGEIIVTQIDQIYFLAKVTLGDRGELPFPLSEIGTRIFYKKEHQNLKLSQSEYISYMEKDLEMKLEKEKKVEEARRKEQKIAAIQEQFSKDYLYDGKAFVFDKEQVTAIISDNNHTLVSARAGSGKTRVIIGRVLYLLDHLKANEKSICVLAFNKNAAEEIKERLKSKVKRKKDKTSGNLSNIDVKTFHSLAYQYADTTNRILSNDKNKFIKLILEDLKESDPAFQKEVYKFFRKESTQIDKKNFSNPESYYAYIRNMHYQSLKGDTVKSWGEKWIADYLYEHGIDYYYEYEFYPAEIKRDSFNGDYDERINRQRFLDENSYDSRNGMRRKTLKPDFYLTKHNLVWEHWAISEQDSKEEREEFNKSFSIKWEDYQKLMHWKQKFWSSLWRSRLTGDNKYIQSIKNVKKMLETSVLDMNGGREAFEKIIDALLQQEGIIPKHRDQQELILDVWSRSIDRFSSMMSSFIDKYQQMYFDSNDDFMLKIEDYKADERTYAFLKIGLKVLKHYEKILKSHPKPSKFKDFEQYDLDFNQLIAKATQRITAGDVTEEIKDIEHIIIDEYQDFSRLFHCFIASIKKYNPNIKIFCVGDTWQAINRFMGADTRYFKEFCDNYADSIVTKISTNYRSSPTIVNASNNFMQAMGIAGNPATAVSRDLGRIEKVDLENVWIDIKNQEEDKYYLDVAKTQKGQPDFVLARTLKKCVEIIVQNQSRSIYILNRTNKYNGSIDLLELENKIHKLLIEIHKYSKQKCKETIKTGTMHSSKGVEADVVILLSVDEGKIPLLHSDNALYEIFGTSHQASLTDEANLFYVAMTRAKEKLYFICSAPSDFLNKIGSEVVSIEVSNVGAPKYESNPFMPECPF